MRTTGATPEVSALPLGEGDRGNAVLDVQSRLAELDLDPDDPPGHYGPSTADAVRAFQGRRGLEPDGRCDQRTWNELVGAGYRLGDRLLYRTRPMLRGDDVAELQHSLSALGFDPGRIDGIFGDETVTALVEFQRNVGEPVDGICGRATLSDISRLHLREGGSDLVSPLRERLRVATAGTRGLVGRRIAVGEQGGFSAGVNQVCRALHDAGATPLALHEPDPSRQAAQANAAGFDCFLALRLLPDRRSCATGYYKGFRYESLTSKQLAGLVQASLPAAIGLDDEGICGLALPVLRETRMPAIEVQLGSPAVVVQRTADLAEVLVNALTCWIEGSFD